MTNPSVLKKERPVSSHPYVHSDRILHTPSEFAKHSLFYVQEAGRLKSLKPHVSRREHLDSFLFLLVWSGTGRFYYQGKTASLKAGDCVFIDCKLPYYHESTADAPWELYWVHFNGPQAQSYYDHYLSTGGTNLFHVLNAADFTAPISCLMEIHREKGPGDEITASKYITDLLTLCFTHSSQTENEPEDMAEKLKLVRSYLEENFREKITLDQLSERFFVSKFHLSREFKRYFGMTVGSCLQARRLTHAKELLRFSAQSIEDIAASCGVYDTSHFNKIFRKAEGMTAGEYRKKWQGSRPQKG